MWRATKRSADCRASLKATVFIHVLFYKVRFTMNENWTQFSLRALGKIFIFFHRLFGREKGLFMSSWCSCLLVAIMLPIQYNTMVKCIKSSTDCSMLVWENFLWLTFYNILFCCCCWFEWKGTKFCFSWCEKMWWNCHCKTFASSSSLPTWRHRW